MEKQRRASAVEAPKYAALRIAGKKSMRSPRRRCCFLAFGTTLVIIIAVAVGLGVGLTRGRGSGASSSSSSSINISLGGYNNTNDANGSYWKPSSGTTWQIVLSNAVNNTSFDAQVYDIDLFDNTADMISELQHLGRKVICYFSAGSYEDFRPDSAAFKKSDYANALDGWPGEYWLNTNSSNVRSIMLARIDLAKTKGCDGVDPDNVDGYENDTGLDLTHTTAVDYLSFLASEAHSRNMSIGLKNSGAIVNQTLGMMEWEVNEQCVQYQECADFQPFIAAGKAVFHIEYPKSAPSVSAADKSQDCNGQSAGGFSTILKDMNLDDWMATC
ncbi:MAG: hypothetical protein M1818_003591 [Claussenomyces sp. TS43310]|nr:MAG: hypothetical protein M1818_003591 [Claussenomyces sp. TS43310]